MKKVILAAAFAFAAAIFAGCKAKGADLVFGDWNLIQYNIEGNAINFSKASVSFAAEGNGLKVSGFSGVNSFSGSCKIDGRKFAAGDGFATTRMAGRKEDMEFERSFLNSLAGADGVEVKSEGENQFLYIFNSAEKSEMVFARASLKDSEWVLTSILKGDGVVSVNVEENELPTLKFTEEGKAAGFSGVNYYTMDYSIDEKGKKLSFTLGASTLMASGSKEAMELERLFFVNIDQADSYSVSGENLTIRSKDGKILLQFVKKPADEK
ncbi:MAG: META domain-containing protein [Treponema sp.]|jgi:heat shock protein HslJ|nr:META domain-containing protein [Treponema sp.]